MCIADTGAFNSIEVRLNVAVDSSRPMLNSLIGLCEVVVMPSWATTIQSLEQTRSDRIYLRLPYRGSILQVHWAFW